MLTLLLIVLLVVLLVGVLGGPRYYRTRRTTIVERHAPGTVVEREYDV